jgi:hypothetical protein
MGEPGAGDSEAVGDAPPEPSKTPLPERAGQVVGVLLAVALLIGLAVGSVLVLVGVYPERLPVKANPSFVDIVFDSRTVVAAARIALLFAAGYVIASVIGLIARRQWLTRAGPFEASQAVERLDQETDLLRAELEDARHTIDVLEDQLLESDQALQQSQEDIAELVDLLASMEPGRNEE